MPQHSTEQKSVAAMNSVAAAFGLTLFKIIVGFATGSLGIIAEAMHSGLDLAAASVTAWAVRVSGRPADRDHLYGHGKVENLSALFETGLLLVTCFWIISAAVARIRSGKLEIEVTFWSFFVMAVSIAVDISRSRMLYRVAKKYKSQALEADALHFRTDIWSSAVVILGLFCVKLHEWVPQYEFLHYADAIAAIIVGFVVIQVSFSLGLRAISALMDSAPKKMEQEIISIVEKIPGVIDCHQVRIRASGAQFFVDLHVTTDGSQTLERAHALTEEIENVLKSTFENADVTVHPEPAQ